MEKVKVAQLCLTLATPWTAAHQAPLSMGFSRQEHWKGRPFPSPGDLPNPGIEPRSPTLQAGSLPAEPQGHGANIDKPLQQNVYTEANRSHWSHTSHSDLQSLSPLLPSREDVKGVSEPWQFHFSSTGLDLDSEGSFSFSWQKKKNSFSFCIGV